MFKEFFIVPFKTKSHTIGLRLFVLFALFLLKSESSAQILGLHEGEICRKGDGKNSPDYICRELAKCSTTMQGIKDIVRPKICSLTKSTPIVCCLPMLNKTSTESTVIMKKPRPIIAEKARSATEMCREYSELIDTRKSSDANNAVKDCGVIKSSIVDGTITRLKEFPHMALLGFGEKVDNKKWFCAGSLISDKWILTAAHCDNMGSSDYPRWARVGDLDYLSDTDLAEPKDYKIVQRVSHPDYRPPSYYNDIALYGLEKSVEFSAFVRPICLNTDQFLKTSTLIVTGWGQTQSDGPINSDLQKITLNTIPVKSCNDSYSGDMGKSYLPKGIVDDIMMCTEYSEEGKDACQGFSGSPVQTINSNYRCMYTQIGIISFGKYCGRKDSPSVNTRVSKYISWIEPIVWPKIL